MIHDFVALSLVCSLPLQLMCLDAMLSLLEKEEDEEKLLLANVLVERARVQRGLPDQRCVGVHLCTCVIYNIHLLVHTSVCATFVHDATNCIVSVYTYVCTYVRMRIANAIVCLYSLARTHAQMHSVLHITRSLHFTCIALCFP